MSKIILADYEKDLQLYFGVLKKITEILTEICQQNKINLYSITSRIKSKESLEKKLNKPANSYLTLTDVTDVAGIRITTYFEDDVKRIAELLELEFQIDIANSIDKKSLLDPDRFGYLSIHHVVSLNNDRCKLTEYQRYKNLKIEIQTRSILQHAWAEIEHDLGYKSEQGVPANIRRRFSRLAGILELADQEFITIRDELKTYEEEISEKIEREPHDVAIDLASLRAFVSSSDIVKKLDLDISVVSNSSAPNYYPEYINDSDVSRLKFFNIHTISQLQAGLLAEKYLIIRFADEWLNNTDSIKSEELNDYAFKSGICLFYYCYILAVKSEDEYKVLQYISQCLFQGNFQEDQNLADEIIKAYKNSK